MKPEAGAADIALIGSPAPCLLGQLVNELHYDLVRYFLLPIRVSRVKREFDANEVVGNTDEFRIVEEDGNNGSACDARRENLSLERWLNFSEWCLSRIQTT
jgi:hypothetical protein